MNKQEFKIYMEKCRVPQSLQPIIEQYQHCFGQNLREIGLIKTNPPSEFRLTIARNWNGQPYHTTPYSQTPEEQEAIEKYVQEQLLINFILNFSICVKFTNKYYLNFIRFY